MCKKTRWVKERETCARTIVRADGRGQQRLLALRRVPARMCRPRSVNKESTALHPLPASILLCTVKWNCSDGTGGGTCPTTTIMVRSDDIMLSCGFAYEFNRLRTKSREEVCIRAHPAARQAAYTMANDDSLEISEVCMPCLHLLTKQPIAVPAPSHSCPFMKKSLFSSAIVVSIVCQCCEVGLTTAI